MNSALVVILALAWALVLLPGALRSRRSSPVTSVGTFERAMDVLARRDNTPRGGHGRVVYVPDDAGRIVGARAQRRSLMIERRRRRFIRLLVGTTAALLPALYAGGRWWLLFFALAATFIVYVVLLRRWKAQAEQAAEVVRRLPDVERARDIATEREPVAVGADDFYGVQVATRPEQPWQPQSSVRIRRWEE